LIADRADRVMVMYAGRIVEDGDTQTIFKTARHPYTEALFESIPDVGRDRRQVLYSIPGLPPNLARPLSSCRFAPRCRYTRDRCREEDPRLGGEEPGHSYACFFPLEQSPGQRVLPGAEQT